MLLKHDSYHSLTVRASRMRQPKWQACTLWFCLLEPKQVKHRIPKGFFFIENGLKNQVSFVATTYLIENSGVIDSLKDNLKNNKNHYILNNACVGLSAHLAHLYLWHPLTDRQNHSPQGTPVATPGWDSGQQPSLLFLSSVLVSPHTFS